MSGIVALLHHDGAPVDRELLEGMTLAQRYRGPDGEGVWCDGSIGFGHTLHKTTVEAEHEQQPAALGDRIFITADARIDARDELCDRLRARGIDARTDATDPDLILKAYAAWGEGCFEHLLGDFSFALWDAPQRKLVCAVDHLGVKPFYYANRGGLFAASNSLECVRMHPDVRADLNEIAVGDFLMMGCYQDRSSTIYVDIARIPPGHYLVVERGELRVRRYFTLPEPKEVHWASDDECLAAFEDVLAMAVRDRLRTPRVAIDMSGGLDSPLIALTAKRELERRFAKSEVGAFTLVFDRLIPDEERHYAGIAAASLGIPIDFESVDEEQLFDWIERRAPPQPLDSAMMEPWFVQHARLAARFPTVLTGFDGDALLKAAVRLHWLERLRERRMVALARELTWYVRHERALPPIGIRTALARIRTAASVRRPPVWIKDDFCARTRLEGRWRSAHAVLPPVRARDLSFFNLHGAGWGSLFDSYDAEMSRTALEARHPLSDLRVVRFAFGLPSVPWCVDKQLLRRSLRSLPPAIVTRPKTPLQSDPDHARFGLSGLAAVGERWQTAELAAYVDVVAVEQALARKPPPGDDFSDLLRAVGFGVWLRNRPVPGDPASRSSSVAGTFARATVRGSRR